MLAKIATHPPLIGLLSATLHLPFEFQTARRIVLQDLAFTPHDVRPRPAYPPALRPAPVLPSLKRWPGRKPASGDTSKGTALAGTYSLQFLDGASISNGQQVITDAYISQTGLVPPDTHSLRMLIRGPTSVEINGIRIAMNAVDPGGLGDLSAGDISSFAGQVVELRITNHKLWLPQTSSTVDNIEFSPIPVPEPRAVALALAAAALVLARRRNALRPSDPPDLGPILRNLTCGGAQFHFCSQSSKDILLGTSVPALGELVPGPAKGRARADGGPPWDLRGGAKVRCIALTSLTCCSAGRDAAPNVPAGHDPQPASASASEPAPNLHTSHPPPAFELAQPAQTP